MIKSICVCDKCGKQVGELFAFRIVCKTKDSYCNLGEERKSEYKEYCSSCFNELLDDLRMRELKGVDVK